MAKKYDIAVLGATGMVGQEMLRVLEERNFPVGRLLPLASQRTAGSAVKFKGQTLKVELAEPDSFKGIQIGLFSAGASISEKFAPEAVKRGTVIIDNTSFFRMDPEVPLVVPEVNPQAIKRHKGIIANPNCSTAQMVVVLKPIHDAFKIKRIVVSTYQSVSGWGKEAVDELYAQMKAWLDKKPIEVKILPKQILLNVIPQIDSFVESGYTKEELKMINETKKIMEDDSIAVTATTVRVPVIIGHSEAVNIETVRPVTAEAVRDLLRKAPGVKVVDDPKNKEYPTAIDCVGIDDALVGRIRKDPSVPNGIDLWIVSDNLRKGAATNAVQIAEEMIEQGLL
ncbi:MAG: aspartate-semialdehyde dehydrogenase [Candidatus Saganbacteria bacterium]|nr:aspartate-semialdehyde dehydrogenase [Candidatus Saganbacteria bacterium]